VEHQQGASMTELGVVVPDWTLIGMLRLGLIGTQMLPENTQASQLLFED